jgi:hypothetical protein
MNAEVRPLRWPRILGGGDAPTTVPAHARHHGLGHAPDIEDDDVRRWQEATAERVKELTLDQLATAIEASKRRLASIDAAIAHETEQRRIEAEAIADLQEKLKAKIEHLLK